MDPLSSSLASTDFNPSQYVSDLTRQCSRVDDLLSAREKIQRLAEETNGLLKRNVYKNYTQFIETAKEISYLESEMYQLSHMLTEQQSVLNSLLDVSVAGDKISKSSERETEVDEDNSKNLSFLLEKVEGYASSVEMRGRSALYSGELAELNVNDYKIMHQVFGILLNDGLMISVRIENRRGPVQYRFQSMYELDNLAVVNIKEDPKVKNAFKILMFPDSRLFQCATSSLKKEWLTMIEQAKKNKSGFKRESSVIESSPTSSLYSEKSSLNPFDDSLTDGSDTEAELSEWLLELPEDLDVCIAQREFEQAVDLIHKANEHFASYPKNPAVKEMRERVDSRVKQLVDILINELQISPDRSTHGGPRAARKAVSVLIRLGKSSKACDLFLKRRTVIVKQAMKQQKMEGATTPYIEKLCSVFFSSMTEAGLEFTRAFGNNNSCASAFVVWAKNQLQQFVNIFSRHVFTPQVTPSVAAECIAYIRNHCGQLLKIGLDLTFVLNNSLQRYVERIISESRDKLLEAIKLRSNEDKWRAQNHQNTMNLKKFLDDMKDIGIDNMEAYVFEECWISLTSNTTAFSKMYLNFLDDLLKLYTSKVRSLVNSALVTTFQTQMFHVANSYQNAESSNKLFINKNAAFLLDTLLPLAETRYKEKLGHSCLQLAELKNEYKRLTPGKMIFTKYSNIEYV